MVKNVTYTFHDLWRLMWPCVISYEKCYRSVSWAIFCFFRFGVAIIVPEIMAGIPDKQSFFEKFDLWWPLLTSIFTWAEHDRNDFEWVHKGLSIAVSPGLLAFLVFELDGGWSFWPPTMAKVAESWDRHPGAGLDALDAFLGCTGSSRCCPRMWPFRSSGLLTALRPFLLLWATGRSLSVRVAAPVRAAV